MEVTGVLQALDEPAHVDCQLEISSAATGSNGPAQLRLCDLLVRRRWSARLADSLQRQLRPVRQVLELVHFVERHYEETDASVLLNRGKQRG